MQKTMDEQGGIPEMFEDVVKTLKDLSVERGWSRLAKDFEDSDSIRDILEECKVVIKDVSNIRSEYNFWGRTWVVKFDKH